VFVTTERGSVLAYAAAGCPPALVCRPLWVWQGGASSPYESTPAVGRTTSFVGAPNRLHALDASTGRRRWSGVVEGFGEDFAVTTPVIANGVLYVTAWVAGVTRFAVPGFP
jgi:outer membrane protein assembly factor BamB